MLQFTDFDRRRRLAVRHGLVRRFDTIGQAARAMTALHATEAATVHLSLGARVDGVTVDDVDGALYDERSVVKQVALRRTLFAFPRELLPAAWGSAAARVARQQRTLVLKGLSAGGAGDPEGWLAEVADEVLAVLADGTARTTAEVREAVPALARTVQRGTPGTRWAAEVPVAPEVMTLLGAEGRVVRARNAGHWRLNKPAWTTAAAWLGADPEPTDEATGYAELVRGWLRTFGPGTEDDVVWWLGATKTAVRRALADVDAVPVALEDGATGWVLPDDTAPVTDEEAGVGPWAALLPTLDPTVMGWKARSFYLDAGHTPYLFDSNGNAGNTAWWDGRIVGCWLQDDAARVHVELREDVGRTGRRALDAEAERLTAWLDGVRITNVYASPQMRGARLP
ncbi:winged helix DNA-binding protein [Nocardioides sp. J9]|uniref:winged helix DNA-binding domain-containing protein n=1 Tax=Nocardioides sp. J9 TaxID=935844 RepID=UPI0011A80E38|nr:winged helix DNA-binding domain-containing protein [Nocardioides sp. J9]TWG94863.1 winged helix DNA-binding protein [Nocardioides sp. J9]